MSGVDFTGIGEVATAAKSILGMIFPDKTQEERDKLAATIGLLQAQTSIDQAEAVSTDPLQHWRGGLGWVCTLGYFYNFFIQPLIVDVSNVAGRTVAIHPLDISELSVLTLGMLGLGTMHTVQQIQANK